MAEAAKTRLGVNRVLKLLLAGLTIQLRLLQTALRDVVEAHAHEVVGRVVRAHVGLFDQFEAKLKMLPAAVKILLCLHQVQLVTSESIHRSDPLALVRKEVLVGEPLIDAAIYKRFTQYVLERLRVSSPVVH